MNDQTHELEMDETDKRLAAHAAQAGVSPPNPLLSEDGAPSKEVMHYCKAHNLTLDWVYMGADPKHRLSAAIDQQMNTVEGKGESKMNDNSFYAVKRKTDHIDRLYRIIHLSQLGAAATDTLLNMEHLLDAHLSMYETIHALALEGVQIAEMEQKKLQTTEAVLQAAE